MDCSRENGALRQSYLSTGQPAFHSWLFHSSNCIKVILGKRTTGASFSTNDPATILPCLMPSFFRDVPTLRSTRRRRRQTPNPTSVLTQIHERRPSFARAFPGCP